MIVLFLVLAIVAATCFILRAFDGGVGRVNLTALGLFFLTLILVLQYLQTVSK